MYSAEGKSVAVFSMTFKKSMMQYGDNSYKIRLAIFSLWVTVLAAQVLIRSASQYLVREWFVFSLDEAQILSFLIHSSKSTSTVPKLLPLHFALGADYMKRIGPLERVENCIK